MVQIKRVEFLILLDCRLSFARVRATADTRECTKKKNIRLYNTETSSSYASTCFFFCEKTKKRKLFFRHVHLKCKAFVGYGRDILQDGNVSKRRCKRLQIIVVLFVFFVENLNIFLLIFLCVF